MSKNFNCDVDTTRVSDCLAYAVTLLKIVIHSL